MGQAAFVAFLMAQCSVDFSATQYALLSALASIPRVTVGALAGHVVASVGWATFFVVTFASAIPGIALLVLLRERIRKIEQRDTTATVAVAAR
jgi:PAT family beta-lactamase induction signal transducer AmpG